MSNNCVMYVKYEFGMLRHSSNFLYIGGKQDSRENICRSCLCFVSYVVLYCIVLELSILLPFVGLCRHLAGEGADDKTF